MTATAAPTPSTPVERLGFRRLSGRIAAEVTAPLAELLADADLHGALREALHDHAVLVLRRARPTLDQHIALAAVFGTPEPPQPQNPRHPDHDEICVFDSAGGYKADRWHADETFTDDPVTGAVLAMRTLPPFGGDTLWTNTAAAYDDLSNGMKALLDNRRSRHEINEGVAAVHPVVRTHPVTGRKLLYVNETFCRGIVNLPPSESEAVLGFLLRHVSEPRFTYRHTWDEGDVVIWDNRCTQHYAVFDFEGRRVVHRVGFRAEPFVD